MNASGTALIYATYLGGDYQELVSGIAIDTAGNAYVTGAVRSPDFPTTPGALKRTCRIVDLHVDGIRAGCAITFVSKVDSTGTSLAYSTFLGGDGPALAGIDGSSSEGTGIAVDPAGFAYVTGSAFTADFPTTPGSLKETTLSRDAFVSKLNLGGTALIYVGGTIRSSVAGFPLVNPARTPFDLTHSGFVAKIGEPSCGTEVTGQLDVLQSPVFPLVVPFSLQFAVVWNRTASPVGGPIAYVMHDMQNGIYLGPQRTRCFSVDGDQLTPVPLGGDAALAPGQAVFMGLVFFQTPGAAISYTPRVLSGVRNR